MLTESQLNNLECFGRLDNGSYSNHQGILLKPANKKRTRWKMYNYDEVDGSEEYLLDIESLDDFKDIYFNITLKELV